MAKPMQAFLDALEENQARIAALKPLEAALKAAERTNTALRRQGRNARVVVSQPSADVVRLSLNLESSALTLRSAMRAERQRSESEISDNLEATTRAIRKGWIKMADVTREHLETGV